MLQVKNWLTILLIGLISTNSLAVQFVKAGTPTPYTGYLMTEDEAQNARKSLIDLDTYTKLNESYTKEVDLLQKSLTYRTEQVKILQDENNNIENRKYLYVAGGFQPAYLKEYCLTGQLF